MRQQAETPIDRVAVVIVTYRRLDTLLETLDGLTRQARSPDGIVVVDNGGDPRVKKRIAEDFPTVVYISIPDNPGYAAGLAVGMREAGVRYQPTWFWLLDDDSPPHADHLQALLMAARANPGLWFIAGRGGNLGVTVRHLRHGVSTLERVDFALVDGALVSRSAVDAVGYPREDLFMMFEDIEYSTRIRMAGGGIALAPGIVDQSRHLGSNGSWRSYYQARNHLRSAIDLKSFALLRTWAARMSVQTVADVRLRRFHRMRLRWSGAYDAVRNRMGRTVLPG